MRYDGGWEIELLQGVGRLGETPGEFPPTIVGIRHLDTGQRNCGAVGMKKAAPQGPIQPKGLI